MLSSEIRDTIMIAISAILLSALLGFISFLFSVRNDFAEVRNNEVRATEAMANYREFNKYNNTTLYGEDIVVAVRDYYEDTITIRVNNKSGTYTVDKHLAKSNPSLVDITNLKTLFPTTQKYKAVLVYGQVDFSKITIDYVPPALSSDVSGIVFFYTGER